MRLSSEIARLTAQVEKGEAVRQNVEYELAKTKKEVLLEKKATEDRETEIQKLADEFKSKVVQKSILIVVQNEDAG